MKMKSARFSLNALVISGALLLSLIVVGFTSQAIHDRWKHSQERAAVEADNIVRLLEKQIGETLSKTEIALDLLAERLVEEMSAPQIRSSVLSDLIASQQAHLPEIESLHVADATGDIRFGTNALPNTRVNIADREYFKQLRDTPELTVVIQGPMLSRMSKRQILVLAHGLRDRQGRFLGILNASLELEAFQREFSRLNLGKNGAVTLRTSDMSLLTRVPLPQGSGDNVIGSRHVSQQLAAMIRERPEGGRYLATTLIDQVQRLNAYQKVGRYPLYIIVGLATEDFRQEWQHEIGSSVFLAVLALAVIASGVWFVLRAWKKQEKSFIALQHSEAEMQLAASVFTHSREGILIVDAQGNIVNVNAAFTHITGYSLEEARGRNPSFLQSGRHRSEFYSEMWQRLLERGYWEGEIWNRRKDGKIYPELLSIGAVHDRSGQLQNYVGLFSDITPIKEREQNLEHIARYDMLTGLPNRVLLADRLRQEMAQSKRSGKSMAIVFIDLDGFKQVNDLHGHAVGDELLVNVSRRMQDSLREGDTLARLGGDEFVVLLMGLQNASDGEQIIGRLLAAVAEPLVLGDKVMQVSASAGVTMFPADSATADQLIAHADQAMYRAKQSGRNRYCYYDFSVDDEIALQ